MNIEGEGVDAQDDSNRNKIFKMIDAIFTTETTGFLRKYNGCSRMNCAKVEFDLKIVL